jgi:hypothetical protein
MDDFGQMIPRDAVRGGHFITLKEVIFERSIHQRTQGIVAKKTEFHRFSTSQKTAIMGLMR